MHSPEISPEMTGVLEGRSDGEVAPRSAIRSESLVKWALIVVGVGFLGVVVVLPIAAVLVEALRDGVPAYFRAMIEPDALAALRLTVCTAAIVVPLNVVFGLAAGWAMGKFDFRGKTLLTALIEIPFAVSPVISGLIFVLAIGPRSSMGGWLRDHGVRVIFAWPGIALATAFVTFAYVAREVMTVMESTGRDKEEAAVVLGASGWQTFWRVTLPSIRWGLLYGVILCNARAMGEFGAVSVVSGHVRGQTNTLPLHVEALYEDYRFSAAFAVSSLLVGLAVVTLVAKVWLERRVRGKVQARS
ncbi:MAG TPA: sulfate ABC transporter permease subunit CysW [Polyangiaceae bacterium]